MSKKRLNLLEFLKHGGVAEVHYEDGMVDRSKILVKNGTLQFESGTTDSICYVDVLTATFVVEEKKIEITRSELEEILDSHAHCDNQIEDYSEVIKELFDD